MKLLSRDEFRNAVFKRDGCCVYCGCPYQDAHHIIERRLFSDGGYYLDNGVSLCGECHIKAETTELSASVLRTHAGIRKVVLPDGWYGDYEYTKWGDIILTNGMRTKGPLFNDISVQRIIHDYLPLYTNRVKYPRTYHLPWSEGVTSDDKVLKDLSSFGNVVVTEKMDGENTTLYNDYYHARSIDGRDHWSRSWIKNLHGKIKHEIPDNWRICGENLYAKHSIGYSDLKSFFYVFSIWEDQKCLSWNDTVDFCRILELQTVPVLFTGKFSESAVRSLYTDADRKTKEGYVVRNEGEFFLNNFSSNVAKFVRKEHVGTSHNWMYSSYELNEIDKGH
jgi:hypothetical protein